MIHNAVVNSFKMTRNYFINTTGLVKIKAGQKRSQYYFIQLNKQQVFKHELRATMGLIYCT